MRDAIIVDIDGTIALHEDRRSPFDFTKVALDAPNTPVLELVERLHLSGIAIIFITGRDNNCREDTVAWIDKHVGLAGYVLLMRTPCDTRKDAIAKIELYNNHVKNDYNVKWVLEDRDQMVAAWRGIGLCCLQVAPGAF